MTIIDNPYYSKHQLLTGQYTPGQELILGDGSDYVGGYHIQPNGKYFSEFSPNKNSVELFEKRFDWTEDVKKYNKIKNIITSKYIQPIPYLVIPTLEEYQEGYVYRYFVQKRNNPRITIMEIDVDQYNKINSKNQPGLNSVIWNSVAIKWKLNGASIYEYNEREILNSEIQYNFTGLRPYLKNLLEFSK